MYLSQIKSGMKYNELKKCITINILDFEHVPLEKIHTCSHITEDETNYRMTDVLEIHFLELPKLEREECVKNTDEAILDWLRFINSKEEEGMKMLAKKNEDILEAYDAIKIASMSKEARMAYEARMAEIMDIRTREYEAKEEGERIGIEIGEKLGIKKSILDFLSDIGTIDVNLRNVIEKEDNLSKLKKWNKIAARSETIDEFLNKTCDNFNQR